jgi:hypothetical protein
MLKNTLYYMKYKKDKFLTKRYIILLLFCYYLLSEICLFYIPQNITYFVTELFSSCKYLPIYFNAIFFEDTEVCVFEIFKILKVKRALVPMCTKPLLHNFEYKNIITSWARWWGSSDCGHRGFRMQERRI